MGDRILRRLGGLEPLDRPARAVGAKVRGLLRPRPLRDALRGTWLGHPVHPMLTDVTVGTFTSALLLDWTGGAGAARASRRLIGIGLLSTPPVVATGYADWAGGEAADADMRRVGLIHAASNATATTLFAASYAARRRGASGRGLALAGGTALAWAGYLGGHLALADRAADDDWHAVLDEADVPEGRARCVRADGEAVMVARQGGTLYALADECSHLGGPLHEGVLGDRTITCPWHDSVFDLRDGGLIHGPAAHPQAAWEARVRHGRIEVRRR